MESQSVGTERLEMGSRQTPTLVEEIEAKIQELPDVEKLRIVDLMKKYGLL